MLDRAAWVPEDVDITVPSSTRMYDYMIGGGHNFAVDRELVDKLLKQMPTIVHAALRNRAFLRRAVLTLVEAGVRQFLDIGSGIPTAGNMHENVHEIVQRAAPDARVVYVDIDPVAVAHSELVLADNDRASAILADMLRASPPSWSAPDYGRRVRIRSAGRDQPETTSRMNRLSMTTLAASSWSGVLAG